MPSKKTLRVALTGGTGFSGAFILPQLVAAGHDVVTLARKPQALAGKCQNVITGDLSRDEVLQKLVTGADVVLHVGGATSAPDRAGYFEVNAEGTKRLYRAALAANVKRFIFVSSMAAREPDLSDYGASKRAAEEFLQAGNDKNCSVLILRPPAIYGPGDKATLPLFKLLQAPVAFMPGKRGARFSLLYVEDFARIAVEAVTRSVTGLYELDDQGNGYDWPEVAAVNRALTGAPSRVMYLPHPVVHAVAGMAELASRFSGKTSTMNRQKIREIYHHDWVARSNVWPLRNPTTLQDGFARTIAWYQGQGLLPRKTIRTRSAA